MPYSFTPRISVYIFAIAPHSDQARTLLDMAAIQIVRSPMRDCMIHCSIAIAKDPLEQ